MVGRDDKDGVVVPWLLLGCLKEAFQCMVCIANAFVHNVVVSRLILVDVLVAFWHFVWMV